MNNQYRPKIDNQPNPDFEEINQWEVQPEYLPPEQDSPFNQDVNIEKDALQEAKDLYFGYLLDGKNLSEEEKFLILEEFTGSDILLGECYLRIFDRIDLSQIDSEMMDCFSKSGSTDYDSFIHSIVGIAGKNNIDIEGLVLSNFPNTRLSDGFNISWEVDNNNSEITEKVETIARKKFNDFCNNPKDSYLSCDVFRGSICEMYEQNIESCFNSLSEEQEKEIFDVVYNKIDELCFDESGNEKSFSDVVKDKFSNLRFIKEDKIFDIGRLSSSSSSTRVCEFIRRKNLDDVSQEERKIIANLVKNRADDILFGEQGQRILKPLSNYNRKLDTRRDLRSYTKKLLGQEFLQEDELLNFWLNGDDSPTWDLYRIAKKYTQIDDSFGKNGNIVPTEDFIRFYIYSRGEYDNCFDDFLSEESPTRLAIESPNLKAESSYINHNVLYYYGDNRDLRLLNFAEYRDIFDDLCSDSELGENSTRCLLEANLYNVDNAKYLKNIASLGDYSAIKYAMGIFNEDPDIYGDRLEVVNEIVKSPNFHFIDGISRKKFDISNEALQVYDGIDPDSNTAIIIYQLFEKNKNFDLYYRDKDLINELDGLDKSLVRAVVSLIENNDLADNLDKIRSLNDSKNVKIIADIAVNDLEFAIAISEEADRIDPNMIDIVHDVYLSTKKVEN